MNENKRARERERKSCETETEQARERVKEVGRARQRQRIRGKETYTQSRVFNVNTTFDCLWQRQLIWNGKETNFLFRLSVVVSRNVIVV